MLSGFCLLPSIGTRPGRLFSFDQPIEGRIQRSGNSGSRRLTRDRAGEKIYLGVEMMLHVIKHRGWMIGASADFVHLPGIILQCDAEPFRDLFAFFDKSVE